MCAGGSSFQLSFKRLRHNFAKNTKKISRTRRQILSSEINEHDDKKYARAKEARPLIILKYNK